MHKGGCDTGGTYWILQESQLLSGSNPGETPGAVQVVRRDLEREQGWTGGRVIIGRMVSHRYVRKTVTNV